MFEPAQQRAAAGHALCGHHTVCWLPCQAGHWLAHVCEALGGSQHLIGQMQWQKCRGRVAALEGWGGLIACMGRVHGVCVLLRTRAQPMLAGRLCLL
jgi:hypothetical protein